MKINREWKDFEILATGDGEKLERWGDTVLLRPDPQVIWRADKPLTQIRRPDARYIRSQTGGGRWEASKPLGEWVVGWRELKFKVKPMGLTLNLSSLQPTTHSPSGLEASHLPPPVWLRI